MSTPTSMLEVLGSHFGLETDYPDSGKCWDSTSNRASTAFYHILSN
jgi:hypothetical protein